jgi:PTS system nitrogen regulatory IIA component
MSDDDFDIEGLALYLHCSAAQIAKMVDRGKIPGRRIAGQWRFSRPEINRWLESRIGSEDAEDQRAVEGVLRGKDEESDTVWTSLADLIPLEAIGVPLAAKTQSSVITSMVELATRTGFVWDPEKLVQAVRAREELHPTALENGVALLHPRRPMPGILGEPVVALGRTVRGIPFGGARGMLTDIFFLICSVDDRGHLRTLARISRLIADPLFLSGLREREEPRVILDWIRESEEKLGVDNA